MQRHLIPLTLLGATAFAVTACGGSSASPTSPPPVTTSVASVTPAGGTTNVATTGAITITFSHAMMSGMESYIALHQDSVTGPVVAGTASWSADRTQLTFTPGAPLLAHTTYVLHMGGGMRDSNNAPISYANCPGFGGQSVTGGMMSGGGMMGGGNEMGSGWKGSDGNYGMEFAFTTA